MKLLSCLSPSDREAQSPLRLASLLISFVTIANAVTFKPAPSSNVDLSNLGHIGLAGDFDGISLYQFQGQSENGFNTNGSQGILSQFPNGDFATLASSDAAIRAMCTLSINGTTTVIVGGNFTSLGGVNTPGAAMFNPNTSSITPLSGLSGQVSALLCDQDTDTVYVGGTLMGVNSTNAVALKGSEGKWTSLPFKGFNGPVTSIVKDSDGHIIFGGEFTALGNATGPSEPDQQQINIAGATITSGSSATTAGFSDPKNIICKSAGTDAPGSTWLLADKTPGFFNAEFGFGFLPTKLRLWNTHQDGRGTKTWRYTAHPIDGIMNFTYIDPATGNNASCSSQCPLSSDPSVPFQDFHFVNVIGMNGFRVDISDYYGNGGGLDGIALFEDNIVAYAINTFNEPTCAGIQDVSKATKTGPWKVSPSLQSGSGFLTADVSSESASVVFFPDIKQSGNYSVNMYTPGCIQDNSCATRGQVTINGSLSSDSSNSAFSTQIFQSNNFDKYDRIYFGYIEASTSSFRPSVTLAPSPGQNIPNHSIVAQSVGFILVSSSGGLNNLFEYDPSQTVIDPASFTNSTIDKAGVSFGTSSKVNTLATSGSTTFVGGNFSTSDFKNIVSIDTTTNSLSGGGLNGEVVTMAADGNTVYVGGHFTDTSKGGATGLNNIAAYDASKNTWSPLGAGVSGEVLKIVPLQMNISTAVPETVIAISGDFSEVLAAGSNSSIAVSGFAIWVPSHSNWLQNLGLDTPTINGEITSAINLPGNGSLIAGSLTSSQLGVSGAVGLTTGPRLSALPVKIKPTQPLSNLTKRATTSSQNYTGVVTGLFYETGGRNITVLGGHFEATGSNGSDVNNLLFLNGSNADAVTGVGSAISSDSTIFALALQGDNLYAGGSLTGKVDDADVDGLVIYNLLTDTFASQPPALGGGTVSVNTITTRPSSTDVYVGGSFSSAGSLTCPGVCVFSSSVSQWNRPGSNLAGTANTMLWTSTNSLTVGGALTLNEQDIPLATYDAKAQSWTEADGAASIPGPVTALTQANSDASQLWVAGTASNGSAFVMNYDGSNWQSAGDTLGAGSIVRGLQMLPLTKDHATSSLVSTGEVLMVSGALILPGFGNASAALFNGTSYEPFILTSSSSNSGGSLSQLFSQEQNFFKAPGK
jgi:hypothetical protein